MLPPESRRLLTPYYRKPGPPQRLSARAQEVERLVRSRFSVKESFALPEGELEFQVAYDGLTKDRFAQLVADARALGFRPELTGTKDECVLLLR